MNMISLYLADGGQAAATDRNTVTSMLKEAAPPYWLSITAPTEEDLGWLGKLWHFHPLTLEDCRTFNPRPKLEDYPGYLFLVVHEVSMEQDEVSATDIQIYFSQDYLITVQRQESEVLGQIRDRSADLSRGTDLLLYRILDLLNEDYFDLLGKLDERIEDVEDEVVARPSRQVPHRIFLLRRDLVDFMRLIAPLREVLHQIAARDYPFVKPDHQLYFRDVLNSLVYIQDMIETQRELAGGALEAYLSSVSNNLNEAMKGLTIIATIFLPLSFIVGMWGMNFQALPFHSLEALWATIAIVILLPLAMLGWFKSRGWL